MSSAHGVTLAVRRREWIPPAKPTLATSSLQRRGPDPTRGNELRPAARLKQPEPRPEPNTRAKRGVPTESAQTKRSTPPPKNATKSRSWEVAERSGFEPEDGSDPVTALAMRRFRPLSHLSALPVSRPRASPRSGEPRNLTARAVTAKMLAPTILGTTLPTVPHTPFEPESASGWPHAWEPVVC